MRMLKLFFALLCFIPFTQTLACTDFRLTAADGTILVTRSMEFAMDLKSNLRSSNRGRAMTTVAPDGKPGMSWKAKYGYVYLDGANYDAAVDGMNEAGLSFEALYLPEFAMYQTVPAGSNGNAVPYIHLGDWILGNFKTIDEVKAALANIFVYAQKIPGQGDIIFPLHFSIFDSSGKGIVVEYIGGKLNISDNIGVMTNSPNYSWHLSNLQNYLHLTPVNPKPVIVAGMTYEANGQGFGMIGLPGDMSPPSRFIKTATLLKVAAQAADATTVVNLAEHIINNVDIMHGLAREPSSGNYIDDYTQWVVFKDLTHKVFYYRTYADLTLRSVALDKVDFTENAKRLVMPITSQAVVVDMTSQFVANKST